MYIAGLFPCRINKHSTPYFIRLYISSFHHGLCIQLLSALCSRYMVARDPWSPPSMHILIDSVFRLIEENPWSWWKIHKKGWVRVGQKHGTRETVDYYILIKCCDLSQNANFIGGGRPCPWMGGRRKKKKVRTKITCTLIWQTRLYETHNPLWDDESVARDS